MASLQKQTQRVSSDEPSGAPWTMERDAQYVAAINTLLDAANDLEDETTKSAVLSHLDHVQNLLET